MMIQYCFLIFFITHFFFVKQWHKSISWYIKSEKKLINKMYCMVDIILYYFISFLILLTIDLFTNFIANIFSFNVALVRNEGGIILFNVRGMSFYITLRFIIYEILCYFVFAEKIDMVFMRIISSLHIYVWWFLGNHKLSSLFDRNKNDKTTMYVVVNSTKNLNNCYDSTNCAFNSCSFCQNFSRLVRNSIPSNQLISSSVSR